LDSTLWQQLLGLAKVTMVTFHLFTGLTVLSRLQSHIFGTDGTRMEMAVTVMLVPIRTLQRTQAFEIKAVLVT
jgi:hypothetical protein